MLEFHFVLTLLLALVHADGGWIQCATITTSYSIANYNSFRSCPQTAGYRWRLTDNSGVCSIQTDWHDWEYPNNNFQRSIGFYFDSFVQSGYISPAHSGNADSCGIQSSGNWDTTTVVKTRGSSGSIAVFYYSDDVDCEMNDWENLGDCSVTCGVGQQQQTRTVSVESVGEGSECPSDVSREVACDMGECPAAFIGLDSCEWIQINKNNKLINDEHFFGYECPEGSLITSLRLQGFVADSHLQNNPTELLCCQTGGHTSVTESCQDYYSSSTGDLQEAVCEENFAIVGLYDLVNPTLEEDNWEYQSTQGHRCCEVQCEGYCEQAGFGINREACHIIDHPGPVDADGQLFTMDCPKDTVLVKVIDDDVAVGVQEVQRIVCCELDNIAAPTTSPSVGPTTNPSVGPTTSPTTDVPSTSPTTSCFDCIKALHGRSIEDEGEFVLEFELCLSACCD